MLGIPGPGSSEFQACRETLFNPNIWEAEAQAGQVENG